MEFLIQNKIGNIKFTESIMRQVILLFAKYSVNFNAKINEIKITQLSSKSQYLIFHLMITSPKTTSSISYINSFVDYIEKRIELNLQILNPIVVVQLN